MDKSLAQLPDGLGLVASLVVALLTLGGIYLRMKSSPTKRRVFALLAGFGVTMTLGVAALEVMRRFSPPKADASPPPAPTRGGAALAARGGERGAPPAVEAREPPAVPPVTPSTLAVERSAQKPEAKASRNVVNGNNNMTRARVTNNATVTGIDNVVNSGNVVTDSVVVNNATISGDQNVTNSGNVTITGALTNGAELGRP